MLNESGIARRYLSTQKKRTVLLTMGVALAIALISTVFSMLNLMQAFEVRTTIEDSGVWEVMAGACTPAQAAALQKRVDVSASGKVAVVTQDVQIGGTDLQSLTGADAGGFTQRHWLLQSGKLPRSTGEIALEGWALQKLSPGAKIGDTLILTIAGKKQSYTVSGILRDNAMHRDSKLYMAWISLGAAQQLNGSDDADVLMQVAGNADIGKFVKSVESEQHLSKDQMQTHGTLLAATGRSDSREVIAIYAVGAVLGLVVLFAAIVMIYNAFNMSVTQRMRQFGLLRAIGATPKQVRRMVRAEAAQVSLLGVLPGVALGAVVSMLLNLLLRSTFPAYFGGPDAPVVFISWPSLAIGAIVGILGTLLSALRPARRAGKVSPVEAIAAMPGANFKKRKTMGVATHLLPVEAAIALRQVLMRKRAFLLTAVSLAFGILLLLAFSPVTDFFAQGTRHTYDLGDVYALTTTPGQGFSDETVRDMSKIDGVQSISPKRIGQVDATFAYSLLGENYQDGVKNGWLKVSESADGMVQTGAKSEMVGLSDTDIRALQSDLILGKIDPAQLDRENGVLLMLNSAGSGRLNLGDLRPGDIIRVKGKSLKICGIVQTNDVVYAANNDETVHQAPLLGMYTTNKVMRQFMDIQPNLVTMMLRPGTNGDTVAARVKELTANVPGAASGNQQAVTQEAQNANMIGNVFVYGFIGVIALIGVLNIINTIGTNVLVRTREIGLLRAGGMTMGQVTSMLVNESILYGIFALVIGLAAGIPLNHWFSQQMVQRLYGLPWSLPWLFIAIACAVTVLAIFLSLVSPLRQIKKLEITRAVTVE